MKKFLALMLCIAIGLAGCMGNLNVKNLSGDELVTALAFTLSDFESLSPEEKTAYTAAFLDLEIMNGGLCQFFANCPDCAAFVPEALDRLGTAEHKALYEQFLAENAIDPLDPMFLTESIEEFSQLYDLYPWDDFDDAYCALTPMSELLEAYIRANPNAF